MKKNAPKPAVSRAEIAFQSLLEMKALRASSALSAYRHACGLPPGTDGEQMIELIKDLLHLMELKGIDPRELKPFSNAQSRWEKERRVEPKPTVVVTPPKPKQYFKCP